MDVFDKAVSYLFENEGSAYSNDPIDAGGPTRWGVTLRSWTLYTKNKAVTSDVIAKLTIEDVKPFYRDTFWEPLKADQILDARIAIALFDTAVLYGLVSTILLAQKAANQFGANLTVDGNLGSKTLTGINSTSPKAFISTFTTYILQRINVIVRDNPQDDKYADGWIKRALRLSSIA